MVKVLIRAIDIHKTYPGKGKEPLVVIGKIDLEIFSGEFITIIGPSGCGKTTLLKLISGIEKIDKGEIWIDSHLKDKYLPIVWQEHRLLPWRTVFRNITFPLELRKEDGIEVGNKATDLIDLMGLNGFEAYYPGQISGGMRARVALARALVTGANCLLMDEPFASIDYIAKEKLFKEFESLRSMRNLTILYVTHNLKDAIKYSDSIIVLSARPARVIKVIRPNEEKLTVAELEEQLWNYLE